MLGWLRRKARRRETAHQSYQRIVAAARRAAFYRDLGRDLGVADSMEGRFEMIVLHLVLVLRRLKAEGGAGQRLGQRLMEHLVADMDDALRQIGIGDMGVPRRVKRAAAALAERARDYGRALDSPRQGIDPLAEDQLATALATHVYRTPNVEQAAAARPHAIQLAAYVRAADQHLAAQSADDVLEGRITFPDVIAT